MIAVSTGFIINRIWSLCHQVADACKKDSDYNRVSSGGIALVLFEMNIKKLNILTTPNSK
jgi:hypothetical protein